MHDDLQKYAEEMSALVRLRIPEEYQEGVLRQLKTNLALAEPLLTFELAEEWSPAPVFRP